jgi:molecular chaperone GrpE
MEEHHKQQLQQEGNLPGQEEREAHAEPMNTREDGAEADSSGEDTAVELNRLKEELEAAKQAAEEWRKKAEETHGHYLRALADLENYRRRAKREKEEALKYATVPLLEALLPVLDNFERALDAADQNGDAQVLKDGIEMVYRQFLGVLSQAGLTLIEAEGKPFNPHEHNAVMQVESPEHEPGMVVEELQAGYRYLDRVIRPSMVKVSK